MSTIVKTANLFRKSKSERKIIVSALVIVFETELSNHSAEKNRLIFEFENYALKKCILNAKNGHGIYDVKNGIFACFDNGFARLSN